MRSTGDLPRVSNEEIKNELMKVLCIAAICRDCYFKTMDVIIYYYSARKDKKFRSTFADGPPSIDCQGLESRMFVS